MNNIASNTVVSGALNSEEHQSRAESVAKVKALYGDITASPCPFTQAEIDELDSTKELLVYLPKGLSATDLCSRWDIKINTDLSTENMIRSVMITEDQWFVCSASATPELINDSGKASKRIYEDQGLHGMDLRRYLAFLETFKAHFGTYPDQTYWCFLLSGSYDRSGISVIGFDSYGVLSHHGWMKNFKAKFAGSRYIVIAPRIEITEATADVPRAYRGKKSADNQEAGLDRS